MSTPVFGRPLDNEKIEPKVFGRPLEEHPEKLTVSKKATQKTPQGLGGKAIGRGLSKALGNLLDLFTVKVDPERYPEERFSFEEVVDKLLPQSPEAGFAEKAIERGAGIAPYLLGGEAGLLGKLGRAGLSGLFGQTTEELGGGPIAQTVAEMGGLAAPGLGKRIIPKKGQKEAVEMLRRRGVSEKEIAPLIPSERKSAILGKYGTRNFRTKNAAKKTRESLGNLYSQIAQEGEKGPILSSDRASLLQSNLNDKIEKLPASVRRVIKEDVSDLFNKPIKASDLTNLWQDLNSQINWKSIGGGKKRLNSLKEVLLGGIEEINPQMAKDFELTNELYSKFNKLYKNLQPQSLDRLLALGELGAVLGSFFKFGPKGLTSILGAEGARHLSTEMLINPRLQNLSLQMVKALNQNKIGIAKKIQEKMKEEFEKSEEK